MFPILFPAIMLAAASGAFAVEPSWGSDPIWDDGRAEVAKYASIRSVYGSPREFETILVTVKEEFDPRSGVKADRPYEGRGLITVLKTNLIATIPTANYPYHYMASTFVRRDDPLTLMKMAVSSQEWCGTTFKEVITWDGPTRLVHHSYFDGQADGSHPILIGRDAIVEEQLLTAARAARLGAGQEASFLLHATLLTHQAPPPSAPRRVRMKNAGSEDVETVAGRFRARRLEVVSGEEARAAAPFLQLWIEEAPRAALVRLEAADGRRMTLTSIERRDYWSR